MEASDPRGKEDSMPSTRIERVDDLPLILTWLLNMHVSEIIDGIWLAHGRWEGLSYGRLALLFVAYIIHQRTHRLMKMDYYTGRKSKGKQTVR